MKRLLLLFLLPFSLYAQEEAALTKIAFGSCSKQDMPEMQMWDEINAENADLWVWLGDIIYGDSDHLDTLEAKYARQKAHPGYQELITKTPVIGVWDDHDYGVNDGDRTFPRKKASKDLMFDFLDYPEDHPDRLHDGAYQSYIYGPKGRKVKVILLDTRYFRDPLGRANKDADQRYYKDPKGQLLGEEQWKWLEGELKNSSAQVHILVSSIQLISSRHPYEKWSNFPLERERIFKLLSATKPAGLVLVSGDRHIGEVSMMLLEDEYAIYEMTTSGLTNTWTDEYEEENPYRLDRAISRNYGLVELDWSGPVPGVSVHVKGPGGESLIRTEVK